MDNVIMDLMVWVELILSSQLFWHCSNMPVDTHYAIMFLQPNTNLGIFRHKDV